MNRSETTISLDGDDWRVIALQPGEWANRQLGTYGIDTIEHSPPGTTGWLPATVPGDVQSDCLAAGEIPDIYRDRLSLQAEWTSQRSWVYHKDFTVPPAERGRRAVLRFDGVDHACHVWLNGQHLGDHVGMYTPFEFDVTELLRAGERNRLVVAVEAAPGEPEQQGQLGWTNQIRLWKARFTYDWDWCTRLVPLGIWESVRLILSDAARITEVWVRPSTRAVTASVELDAGADFSGTLQLRLLSPEGEQVGETSAALRGTVARVELPVSEPRLWFPNGYGDQPLYTAVLTVLDGDGVEVARRAVRTGFREARFIDNQETYAGALPYRLEVNGVPVFIKGWNWVPIDQLYGRGHEKEYRHLLRLARDAGCNLLRVWGGGLLERELFYDLCDEYGIVVWQEFIQSSSGMDNEPASDAEYLAYVREQAEQMVPRRRNHVSLAIWCGGNELAYPDRQPIGLDHPNVATLHEVVRRLHPDALYLPTSPSGRIPDFDPLRTTEWHDIHGPWQYIGDAEHHRFYNTVNPLLHSEFGVEGMTNIDTLRRSISAEYLWPPDRSNVVMSHHGAWWLNRPVVESLFGPIRTIEDFVRASQWLQAEGLGYAVSARRRNEGHCAGTIPWQYNEAWTNSSCTNCVDFYGFTKPAYWAMKTAYAAHLVSAEYDRLQVEAGQPMRCTVSTSSDRRLRDAEVHWRLHDVLAGSLLAEGSGAGPLSLDLPSKPTVVCLDLSLRHAGGAILATNQYLFSSFDSAPFAPLLTLAPASLDVGAEPGQLRIAAVGHGAVGVHVEGRADHEGPYLSDGYFFHLAAGEERSITVRGAGALRVSAWNAASVLVDVPGVGRDGGPM